IHIGNPVSHLSPSPLVEYSSSHGARDILSCGRVRISGLSRLKLKSYANSFRVTLTPVIPEKFHGKIGICFHRNSSLGLCQCLKDDWGAVHKGNWSTVMSPYANRYLDVKLIDGVSGSITVSVEEAVACVVFGCGFLLLLLAPIFSNWVPFYYSSSMVIGILLVILVILFQGMKLLPTGRKNVFYLTIYGSLLGVGSFLVQYFSMLINSILLNFGLNEDMYNPVSVFVLVALVLVGAALGYWTVRKFVMSEDGSVDVGVANFVKWAMRTVAMTFIFQSTLDTPLALLALASCWGICLPLHSLKWRHPRSMRQSRPANRIPVLTRARQSSGSHNGSDFPSRFSKRPSGMTSRSSPKSMFAWSDSPTKGLVLLSPDKGPNQNQDYYSTFHKTSTRKRFSKREWEDFTRESTRQAVAEWVSSPEFTDWIIENADRISIDRDKSSDNDGGSGSDSETSLDNCSGLSFFKWY
ncbi:hypothetical protein IFM89_003224, partial [Coptis chinensis]